jgi:ATP-dependent Clp protease adaptor protein ClpS
MEGGVTAPRAPDQESELDVRDEKKTARPRRYSVVFHNDDYTTRDFVVSVLMEFFGKTVTEATQIMLHVHFKGWGVAGVYTRDVAETKVEKVVACARSAGHPLKVTAEPEGFEGNSS